MKFTKVALRVSSINNAATVVGMTLKATNGNGFGVNGTLIGSVTVSKNSTIEVEDTCIYYPTQGTLIIENGKIAGTKLSVAVKGGTVNISLVTKRESPRLLRQKRAIRLLHGGGVGTIEVEGYAFHVGVATAITSHSTSPRRQDHEWHHHRQPEERP